MKPLYLSIKGFGPYIKAEIPEETFQLIHQEKFFLITGEIGAGKTTLFDAIFFALFGEATFPDRTPKDLISHYLLSTKYTYIEPEVSFKFIFKGQIYQLLRKPPFGARQTYFSSLWINERLYSQKKEDIAEKMREIFGLEGKYFKKIFMLPQGEYRELLLSEPRERKILFEKLFEMEILSSLETYFKDRTKEIKNHAERFETELSLIKNQAKVSAPEELNNKITEVEKSIHSLNKEYRELNLKIKIQTEELKKKEALKESLEKFLSAKRDFLQLEKTILPKIEIIKEKIEKLKKLRSKIYHYENIRKLWSKLKDELIPQRKKLSQELKNMDHLLKLKEAEFLELQNKAGYYEELEKRLHQKKSLLEDLTKKASLLTELSELERECAHKEDKLLSLEKLESETLEEKARLTKLIEDLKQKEEIKKRLKELEDTTIRYIRKFEGKNAEVERLQREITLFEKERESLQKDYSENELEWMAFKLSENLKEGFPCPVCGSKKHPKKASLKLFSKNFETLKNMLNKIETELARKKEEFSRLEGELRLLKNLIPTDQKEIWENYRLLQEQMAHFESKEELKMPLSEATRRLTLIEEKEKKILEEKKITDEELKTIREKIARRTGELATLKEFLSSDEITPKELEKEINTLEEELTNYEREKRKSEIELNSLRENLSYLRGRHNHLENELNTATKEYKESMKEVLSLVREGIFSHLRDLKKYYEELSQIEEYEREIKFFEQEHNRLKNLLNELSNSLLAYDIRKEDQDLSKLIIILEQTVKEIEKTEQEKGLLEKKREELLSKLGSLQEQLDALKTLHSRYLHIEEEKKKLEEEYSYIEEIYRLLSGAYSGISFHSFVLSKFLSLILKRANLYLRDFTFGRYHFVEEELFTRKFKLEIFDTYTGMAREVNTLSGGESFLASLAFALGTSDIVIALSKKNPLETLLIDEGFGSLDENTLEKVLQAIFRLSQKTGKIIGIISHLKELKEHFSVIIEIIKSKEGGSKIQIKPTKRSL